jgi:hypothetical protein
MAFAFAGPYRPRLRYSAPENLPGALLGIGVLLPVCAWSAVPTLLTPLIFWSAPIAWPAVMAACVLVGRAFGYAGLAHLRCRGPGGSAIIIGSGDVAVRLAGALSQDHAYGLAPLGLVGPPSLTDRTLPASLLGAAADLDRVISRHRPQHVMVTLPGSPDAVLVGTRRRRRRQRVTVFVVPRPFEAVAYASEARARGSAVRAAKERMPWLRNVRDTDGWVAATVPLPVGRRR